VSVAVSLRGRRETTDTGGTRNESETKIGAEVARAYQYREGMNAAPSRSSEERNARTSTRVSPLLYCWNWSI